jgi:hypothetical protein
MNLLMATKSSNEVQNKARGKSEFLVRLLAWIIDQFTSNFALQRRERTGRFY